MCWRVNKASIVVSLSDHVRRGRPRLCQGAEEQVQDQTLLCQTPTHGLPACPDDPGGRQHGNVRHARTNREKLGCAETCCGLRLKLVSWLVVDWLPVCSSFSVTCGVRLMLGFVMRVESHSSGCEQFCDGFISSSLCGNQVHAHNKDADVTQFYLDVINSSFTGVVCWSVCCHISVAGSCHSRLSPRISWLPSTPHLPSCLAVCALSSLTSCVIISHFLSCSPVTLINFWPVDHA